MEKEQKLTIRIEKKKEVLEKWENLCEVDLVDLDIPGVLIKFKKRIEVFKSLVLILNTAKIKIYKMISFKSIII